MIYGFLNIDKPKGFTSFDVVAKLRKIFDIKKIGHLGTLDPLATGVLVVAIGEATKLIEFINNSEKTYETEITLGETSNTYDAEGEIKKASNKKPTLKALKEALNKFKGEILQIPPIHSAIKIKGKKAYQLARKGKKVELKARKVNIFLIKLMDFDYPKVKILVHCSAGTYIRSIANDLGVELNTGAYLSGLKRTEVGDFKIKNSINISNISKSNYKKFIIPVEKNIKSFPGIILNDIEYRKLDFGQMILREDVKDGIDIFAGFFKNRFAGILERVRTGKEKLLKFRKKLNLE